MADDLCSECKTYTPLVYDHSAGDTICSECGLVLESHLIDESAEWRNFAADESDNHDPVRVGVPRNPLLPNGGLGSTVVANLSGSSDGAAIKRWQDKHNSKEANSTLLRAFKTIDEMACNLGLVDTINNCAKELYKKAEDEKLCGRWRNTRAIMGACLYLACQEEGFPRTFKEIYTVSDGAKKKEIRKAMEVLKKELEVETRTIHARDIATRYCSNLGLSHRTIRAVQETVKKSEEFDIRRNSTSILSAVIYMVTQLSENRRHLREVAQASEVAETTLRKAYRDLYPLASVLIPSWYANNEDINRLCDL